MSKYIYIYTFFMKKKKKKKSKIIIYFLLRRSYVDIKNDITSVRKYGIKYFFSYSYQLFVSTKNTFKGSRQSHLFHV
ncbi:hypothetical protein PUN28_012000 [Cardiocondyla obscurior]|uniref:Uncharacterized protein n=1 Tax=Cardiocondyla obscurior TaxID=286306 RepID=A0AAW2F8X5_9HYME